MEDSKRGFLPSRHGIHLSKGQSHKTPEENELISEKPYDSAKSSLMYVMLCTRRDNLYAIEIVSRYKSDPKEEHWTKVKTYI